MFDKQPNRLEQKALHHLYEKMLNEVKLHNKQILLGDDEAIASPKLLDTLFSIIQADSSYFNPSSIAILFRNFLFDTKRFVINRSWSGDDDGLQ